MKNVKAKVVNVHTIKVHRGSRAIEQLILNLALDGGEQSTSHMGHFTHRK
jgi:hypothetical protein